MSVITTRAVRAKGGKRWIGDREIYFRSAWEANYARYLEWLVGLGQIAGWEYEPKEFWFEGIKRGTRSYKPDFQVWETKEYYQWIEIKGWMDSISKTKLKRFKKYHPREYKLLVVIGRDEYKSIAASMKPMLRGTWE